MSFLQVLQPGEQVELSGFDGFLGLAGEVARMGSGVLPTSRQ
ncbi:hypothetical protein ACFLIM_38830 [Nonomuraea sp. M3C6]|uniref:Uncharacterized protein n=1 Tax=Nonomuraea marmarensis TaxID=3351344 RepID=A0ABW7ASX9_9ACTN